MNTCLIKLNTLEKVKLFVEEMQQEDTQFDLVCGNYTVNAVSVLGILTLDLNKPLTLRSKTEGVVIPPHIQAVFAA